MDYHQHTHVNQSKKLLWVTVLNLSITLVQVIGGILSNSLSLLSDALHNFGDSSALFLAFIADRLSRKQPNEQKTFGYQRIEILAALFNAVVLIAICLYLITEAVERLMHPEFIQGKLMLIIAAFGLLANLISVLILNRDKNSNLNIKAAYLHLMGDTFSSIAVIAGGLAIWLYDIFWVDPVVTLIVAIYIMCHARTVIRETVDILMQSTPNHIDLNAIQAAVEAIPEIDNIHHIHVWKLDDSQIHLETHINLKVNMDMVAMMNVRARVEFLLHEKFGIDHVTLSVGYNCCAGDKTLIKIKEET